MGAFPRAGGAKGWNGYAVVREKRMRVRHLLWCQNILGEAPCWDAARGLLYWVDIVAQRVFRFEPTTGTRRAWSLNLRPSALALRVDGTLLMAAGASVGVFDPATGRYEPRVILDEPRGHRTNDGKVGADGHFWFGTMAEHADDRTGSLYRLDQNWNCVRVGSGIGIPNTMTTTPGGRALYVAESLDHAIYRHCLEGGALGSRELFVRTSPPNQPDGAAIDREGGLWSAHWAGSQLVRYTPRGEIDGVVKMPIANPTSCCFGGDDLRTLYVTSARQGVGRKGRLLRPYSGDLFAFDVEIAGEPVLVFGG